MVEVGGVISDDSDEGPRWILEGNTSSSDSSDSSSSDNQANGRDDEAEYRRWYANQLEPASNSESEGERARISRLSVERSRMRQDERDRRGPVDLPLYPGHRGAVAPRAEAGRGGGRRGGRYDVQGHRQVNVGYIPGTGHRQFRTEWESANHHDARQHGALVTWENVNGVSIGFAEREFKEVCGKFSHNL